MTLGQRARALLVEQQLAKPLAERTTAPTKIEDLMVDLRIRVDALNSRHVGPSDRLSGQQLDLIVSAIVWGTITTIAEMDK